MHDSVINALCETIDEKENVAAEYDDRLEIVIVTYRSDVQNGAYNLLGPFPLESLRYTQQHGVDWTPAVYGGTSTMFYAGPNDDDFITDNESLMGWFWSCKGDKLTLQYETSEVSV